MKVSFNDWSIIRITGEDRVRFLQGLCTLNIETLTAPSWACLLSAKGRVVAYFWVEKEDGQLVLISPNGDVVRNALEKYAIMDDVEFTTETSPLSRIITSPEDWWNAPFLREPGEHSLSAVEGLRIQAGFPLYEQDISEENFPFETPLGKYVDYEKGCYVGQEPVARVHFKGKPNKHLMGAHFSAHDLPDLELPLSHSSKPKAGTVTSLTQTENNQYLALAYIHRDVAKVGNVLLWRDCNLTLFAVPTNDYSKQ